MDYGMSTEGTNLVLDLNGIDEKKSGFVVMPKGEYDAIIDDVDFGNSKKGSPMMTFKYKIQHEEYKNTLFHYCVLDKEFGLATLKKIIMYSGAQVDFGSFNPQTFADNGDAIGLPIRVKVKIQSYQGEKRNSVADVLEPAGDSSMGLMG